MNSPFICKEYYKFFKGKPEYSLIQPVVTSVLSTHAALVTTTDTLKVLIQYASPFIKNFLENYIINFNLVLNEVINNPYSIYNRINMLGLRINLDVPKDKLNSFIDYLKENGFTYIIGSQWGELKLATINYYPYPSMVFPVCYTSLDIPKNYRTTTEHRTLNKLLKDFAISLSGSSNLLPYLSQYSPLIKQRLLLNQLEGSTV